MTPEELDEMLRELSPAAVAREEHSQEFLLRVAEIARQQSCAEFKREHLGEWTAENDT
jgi:hypothetical protein